MRKLLLLTLLVIPLVSGAQDKTLDDFTDDVAYTKMRVTSVSPAEIIPAEEAFMMVSETEVYLADEIVDLGTDVVKWQRRVMIAGRSQIIEGTSIIKLETVFRLPSVVRMEEIYQEVAPGVVKAASFPVYATRTVTKKMRKPEIEFDPRKGVYFIPEQREEYEKKVKVITKSKEEKFNEWRISVGLSTIDLPIN